MDKKNWPRSYDRSIKFGYDVVALAKTKLRNPNGSLALSLVSKSKGDPNGAFMVWIEGESYMFYVNDGRSKNAKAPPVEEIAKWCVKVGIDPKAAFAISKSIAKDGIGITNKNTGFLTKSWDTLTPQYKVELEVEMAKDLEILIAKFNDSIA